MEIKNLLEQARNACSDEDAKVFLGVMKTEFFEKGPLSSFLVNWEGSENWFFGLNGVKDIGNGHEMEIRPEIRGGKLSVEVRLTNGREGRQLSECTGGYADWTVNRLCEKAKELAIGLHRELIESVGVPRHEAERIARDCF